MSGSGSRFSDVGYLLPKPLIPVSGQPMIFRVIDSLPPADKWIFIVRQEHIDNFQIDKLIKLKIPLAIIIPEQNPIGQASTCMLAMPYLDKADSILFSACDNSFLFDQAKYDRLANDSSIDSIIWTFTKDKLLEIIPESWGWIKLSADGVTIDGMSVKIPVSDTPFNDHAVVATFFFKRARDFIEAYHLMVQEDYRINNEFYVDSMPIFLKKLGKKSVIFDVDLYVGWGKPSDLYKYQLMEVDYQLKKMNQKVSDNLWDKFFMLIEKNEKEYFF